MAKTFKVGQRVKMRGLRGTVLTLVTRATGEHKPVGYTVRMDNGAHVQGSKHQFEPVKRA